MFLDLTYVKHCFMIPVIRFCCTLSWSQHQNVVSLVQLDLIFLFTQVAQSVTCLATDARLTVDPGVASSIPARSHTFVEIDHEIISTVILLPSAESFKKGYRAQNFFGTYSSCGASGLNFSLVLTPVELVLKSSILKETNT